jgi:hypothetical protein
MLRCAMMLVLSISVSSPAVASNDVAEPKKADKIVCKAPEETGTRLSRKKKVCMSVTEWEKLGRDSRRELGRNKFSNPGG